MNPVIPGANIFAAIRGSQTAHPFRYRIFAGLWVANLISNFGTLIQSVGASWLMTSIAPTPDMVALVQTAVTLPILAFSLASGAIADIWERRVVLLIGQFLMFFTSASLAALAYFEGLTPALLLGFTFALGAGAALYGPAWQASVSDLVPRSDVPAAVALNSLAFNLARAVGPAVGGVIVAAAGPQAAFMVNAVSYIALIAMLFRWNPPPTRRQLPPESMGPAMVAGLRYASLSLVIRAVLVRAFVFGLCGSAIWALLPLVARQTMGGGPVTYGILLGAIGCGAIVGALGATGLRHKLGGERMVIASTALFSAAGVIAAWVPSLAVVSAALVFAGASWVAALSTFNVTVQLSSPRWVMGRTIAVYQMMVFGGMAAGSWLWGMIAHLTAVPVALSASAAALGVSVVLARIFALPERDEMNLTPSGSWPEPEVTLDLDGRAGPVVVSVEYRVLVENQPAFVAAMRDLRRARRRDGARYWALVQDVTEPEIWIERFESPTWVEHLRQHSRSTVADQAIEEEVRSYHSGAEPPRIRHFIERPLAATAEAEHKTTLRRRPAEGRPRPQRVAQL
jgi:MFS family permease